MPVIQETPQIISLYYKPELDAPHRYYCEWARFYFDLKNYTLSIESDCGNYSYGWVPTPNSESFLKLCSRFDKYYLLYKISSESVVDSEATWENVKRLIAETLENEWEDISDFSEEDIDCIYNACKWYSDNESATVQTIMDEIELTDLEGKIGTYDIYDCIIKDYPASAKNIADIFINEIQPYIEENLL